MESTVVMEGVDASCRGASYDARRFVRRAMEIRKAGKGSGVARGS